MVVVIPDEKLEITETCVPLLQTGTVLGPPKSWLVPCPKISVKRPVANSAAIAACAALRCVAIGSTVFGGAGGGVGVCEELEHAERAKEMTHAYAATRLTHAMYR